MSQSGAQDRKTHNPADGPGKKGKQREDDENSDDGEAPPPPPPLPPPPLIQEATSKEVIHKTDVELMLSNNAGDKGHFLRVITKVKVCGYVMYIIKVC